MVLKRINPFSAAKVAAVIYGGLGLLIGAVFSLISLAGSAMTLAGGEKAGIFGVVFGLGAIIVLPIFYGCIGALGALIGSALYNLAAGWVGGIEVDIS